MIDSINGMLFSVFIVLSFYFTLIFIENIYKGEERLAKQSKLAAVILLAIAMIIRLGE